MCQDILCQTLGTSLGMKDTVPVLMELVLTRQLELHSVARLSF